MRTLKERLEWALGQSGIKRAELARRLGITRGAVSLWFNGTTKTLEGENLTRAATVLDVNPHWLATGEGQRDTKFQGEHVLREPGAEYRASARDHAALISAFEELPLDIQNSLRNLILSMAKKRK